MNVTLVILLVQVVVELGFVTAVMALLPRFMRPDVFFSVTVSPGFAQSAEGRQIGQEYVRRVLIAGLGMAAIILLLFPIMGDLVRALAGGIGIVVLCGITIWAFVSARVKTRPHAVAPTTVREAGLSPRKGPPLGGPALWVGPFLIIAAAVIFLAARYHTLPERIPMHYNAAGEVDRFAAKSVKSVFVLPMVATLVCLLMAAIGWSLRRGLKRSRAAGPAAQREKRMLTLTTSVLLLVQYVIAMLFSAIAVVVVLPPAVAGRWVAVLAIAGSTVMLGLVVALLLRYQSVAGTPSVTTGAAPVGDGTPDANWKWGMIYYNPDDPALWVEKRFGIGYTTNMARPGAWVLLGGMLLSLLAIVALAIWAAR